MHFELYQWLLGAAAAVFIGISKTGVPGVGIVVVPMLAAAYGGRESVGIMLPLLIAGDCFAVAWYRRHAQWDKLVGLLPWVVVGMGLGAVALWITGRIDTSGSSKDLMGMIIGVMVLIMLVLYFLQKHLGEKLAPHSKAGIAGTGASAGFATTISNAAGPIMTIYLTAQKLPKNEFIGTIAWYFFIINLSKVPIFVVLTAVNPAKPIMNLSTLALDLVLLPGILVGAFMGKWLLPIIPQKSFDNFMLALAAAAAIKLVIG